MFEREIEREKRKVERIGFEEKESEKESSFSLSFDDVCLSFLSFVFLVKNL